MISLNNGTIKKKESKLQLDELNHLLLSKDEIEEKEFLNFFSAREQLILLMGLVVGVRTPKMYNVESSIFGKYRTDFTVSDVKQKEYSFIEFEDASKSSIFLKKLNSRSSVYPWGSRFEKGYSQVVDWYLKLSEMNCSQFMKSEFGHHTIKYNGALIIGRDKFIVQADCRERFDNRVRKSLIDSKHITCYTYDQLYNAMVDQYEILSAFA